jgi:hypothetical protein
MPHAEVRNLDAEVFRYSTIWQHKNFVLVLLPAGTVDDRYVAELTARLSDFHARDTECVITQDEIAGLPVPGAVVADRWGEIVHVAAAARIVDLPTASGLLDWVEYVQRRCPECEGEAK